ncbi:MAG: lipocalin family protein [Bacteroidales bacterium]|nr:lipocalin family protein [Bacteroidales bacterium]
MKKLRFFAMMLCIAALGLTTSCSKDNEDLIIGKWKCVSSVHQSVDPDTHELNTYNNESVGMVMEFTKDGKVTIAGGGTSDYSISGNTLYMDGGRTQLEIKKLTKKEMTLFFDNSEELGYQSTGTLNFEKQ